MVMIYTTGLGLGWWWLMRAARGLRGQICCVKYWVSNITWTGIIPSSTTHHTFSMDIYMQGIRPIKWPYRAQLAPLPGVCWVFLPGCVKVNYWLCGLVRAGPRGSACAPCSHDRWRPGLWTNQRAGLVSRDPLSTNQRREEWWFTSCPLNQSSGGHLLSAVTTWLLAPAQQHLLLQHKWQ